MMGQTIQIITENSTVVPYVCPPLETPPLLQSQTDDLQSLSHFPLA